MPRDLPSCLGGPELILDHEPWSMECRRFVGYFCCLDKEKQKQFARCVGLRPENLLETPMSEVRAPSWGPFLRVSPKGEALQDYQKDSPSCVGLLGAFLRDDTPLASYHKQHIGPNGIEPIEDNMKDVMAYYRLTWKLWGPLRRRLAMEKSKVKTGAGVLRTCKSCHAANPDTVDRYANLCWTLQAVPAAWTNKSNRLSVTSRASNLLYFGGDGTNVLTPKRGPEILVYSRESVTRVVRETESDKEVHEQIRAFRSSSTSIRGIAPAMGEPLKLSSGMWSTRLISSCLL